MRRRAERAIAVGSVAVAVVACQVPDAAVDLTVYGPYVEQEADLFGRALASFEEQTGLRVRYTGSSSFLADFADRLQQGHLPDVVVLPQPALLDEVAAADRLVPLPDAHAGEVRRVVGEAFDDLVSEDGDVVAVPYRFVVKSLVWYRPDQFAQRGYQVPDTLDELDALAAAMIADGIAPWCAGMDDFAATGWWGTDWVEDLLLRQGGAETYTSWAALETAFDDAAVVEAIQGFADRIGREGAVAGGRRTVLDTLVDQAMAPMFDDPPRCLMHRQASFQVLWLPDGTRFGEDVDVFALPPTSGSGAPVVLSGEIAVATSTDEAASDLLVHLLSDAAGAPWLEAGGSVTTSMLDDEDAAPTAPLARRLTEIVEQAPAAVFDASDLMPLEIGSGAFWQGMVDLVAGSATAAEVAADIQAAVEDLDADAAGTSSASPSEVGTGAG